MATTTETERPSTSDAGTDSTSAVQKLRDQADAAVQRIQPQIAAVSTYARNEPTKALLISAATGAALMGLVVLMARGGGRSSPSSLASSTMGAIRDAALDLADSAQSVIADALEQAPQGDQGFESRVQGFGAGAGHRSVFSPRASEAMTRT